MAHAVIASKGFDDAQQLFLCCAVGFTYLMARLGFGTVLSLRVQNIMNSGGFAVHDHSLAQNKHLSDFKVQG